LGFRTWDYLDLSDPEHPKIDLTRLTEDQASVIAEVTYEKRGIERRLKLKLHDKLNALVNLGKHLGLFSERHLLGGLNGGNIQHVQWKEVEFVKSTRLL
jgi:phage terminase small subunit